MTNTGSFSRKKTKSTKKKIEKKVDTELKLVDDEIDFEGLCDSAEGFFVPSVDNDGLISAKSYLPVHEELLPVLTPKGLPCGHVIHAAGDSDTGKTTFAVDQIVQIQKVGGLPLYGLTEIKFDMERAVLMGMDRSKAVFYKPPSLEKLFDLGVERIKKFRVKYPSRPILWIWDSISATPSEYELDESTANHNMKTANAISGALRRNRHFIDREQVCFLMINRVYTKQTKSPWEKQTSTYGGKGPKGFASIQLEFKRMKSLKAKRTIDGKQVSVPLGIETEIENTKNHLYEPFHKVQIKVDKYGFVVGGRNPKL